MSLPPSPRLSPPGYIGLVYIHWEGGIVSLYFRSYGDGAMVCFMPGVIGVLKYV